MRSLSIVPLVLAVACSACSAPYQPAARNVSQSHAATSASTEKAGEMAMEEMQHAQMRRAPKAPGLLAESPPQEHWPSGIVESGFAPLPGSVYDIRNQYHETAGGRHVGIYAGALRESGRGVVVVLTSSLDLHDAAPPLVRRLDTSAVRIEAVSGSAIVLRDTQNGGTIVLPR